MKQLKIGFIGVGNMGGAMARRLVDMGADVTVFDRSADAMAAMQEAGAKLSISPKAVADQCPIVFACLPSPEVSVEVALGADGVVHGQAIEVYVETSTIGRAASEALAASLQAHNVGYLDCPVSGGIRRALEGTLVLIASGAESDYAKALPALKLLSADNCFYLGAKPGLSQVAKLINNHISTAGRIATFEGLAMGAKAGIDLQVLNDVLNAGTARNDTTANKVPAAILSGTYRYGGPLTISMKDVALMIKEAQHYDAALWSSPTTLALLNKAAEAGYRQQDGMRLFNYIQSIGSNGNHQS